ncbi:hypothetical protein BWQ96_09165 [Gracilariopsis chorda]|uniref:Uncharacterized protein n=1 Tax=Gracilariopsis chorda TaxID=448386 RepID=A0A2V3IGI5_9FLOR|nr:hypothetical protein BWQ96_09165 [Gracilariopsis chorda]|eukprot:PXF41133.1 hypothetical protein BWQ96_09165 [Gracilariopsis chorda]
MKKLYSAAVARPLSASTSTPTRLGFATTAWCPFEDLIAVISGDGAVAVFHADSPGETSILVAAKRAPARHLLWRNAPDKHCMLVVADAAARLTFWIARDFRVNVWVAVATLELPCAVSALSWNSNSTALAAVLAQGDVRVWLVPDIPADKRLSQPPNSRGGNVLMSPNPNLALPSVPSRTQRTKKSRSFSVDNCAVPLWPRDTKSPREWSL